MQTLNFILIVVITLVFVIIFVVLKLNIQFYFENKKFIKQTNYLNEIIVQMSKKKSEHYEKIKLSEELEEKLKKATATLSSDIFELNNEMFMILSKNNLI